MAKSKKKNFKVGQKIITKWAASTTFYFRVGQMLFKSRAKIIFSKWGKVYFKKRQTVISKWDSYFKVR